VATALLFDRDQVDELEDWQERLPRIGRSSILWVDLDSPDEEQIRALADDLGLAEGTRRHLLEEGTTPHFCDHDSYVQVTAFAPCDPERRELVRIECLVSERWVVTVHDAPLEVLETFRERAAGSGATGDLDGLEFLANILEWTLNGYLEAFEAIERALEDVDARAMQGRAAVRDDVLQRLVGLRREIGRLRRALTSHRETVLALTRPELEAIGSSGSAARFAALRERLEQAVQAARDSREAVVGSFDVLIASSGQRTNDIMKILTLASVLILPGSLIAGILGMNFKLGFFENASYFWVALAGMAGIAALTLAVARLRDWI
jgi:Mg2+ and Co2+ transporter CorA